MTRLDLEPHETPVDVRNGIIKSEQWCRYYCGCQRCVAKEGGSLSPESVCINWILLFKVLLICLGLLSSGDHFVGCQPQIPAQEWLRSLAWLIKGFWHQSLTLPCQCHYKQLLIIPCPGHGQRRGGHLPNGRSFCIPSNEGPVDQFGPGAKAMSCRSSLSFALNARFESKLCVNFVNARFKVKVACHFASFCSL